jgi:hypothetical protein
VLQRPHVLMTGLLGGSSFFFLRVYSVRTGHVGSWGQGGSKADSQTAEFQHLCRNGASAAHMIKSFRVNCVWKGVH